MQVAQDKLEFFDEQAFRCVNFREVDSEDWHDVVQVQDQTVNFVSSVHRNDFNEDRDSFFLEKGIQRTFDGYCAVALPQVSDVAD